MQYKNNLMEVQLVLKIEPQNRTHLTLADVDADFCTFGIFDSMTEIDITCIRKQTIQR